MHNKPGDWQEKKLRKEGGGAQKLSEAVSAPSWQQYHSQKWK